MLKFIDLIETRELQPSSAQPKSCWRAVNLLNGNRLLNIYTMLALLEFLAQQLELTQLKSWLHQLNGALTRPFRSYL